MNPQPKPDAKRFVRLRDLIEAGLTRTDAGRVMTEAGTITFGKAVYAKRADVERVLEEHADPKLSRG
jgi:hypothetical protein